MLQDMQIVRGFSVSSRTEKHVFTQHQICTGTIQTLIRKKTETRSLTKKKRIIKEPIRIYKQLQIKYNHTITKCCIYFHLNNILIN